MGSVNERKKFNFRLPAPAETSEELMDILAEGSAEFREARPQFMTGPSNYPQWVMWAHDPELFYANHRWYVDLFRLTAGLDGDATMVDVIDGIHSGGSGQDCYNRYMLMCLWMMKEHQPNEYSLLQKIDGFETGAPIHREKLLLLDHPDSDIWTDDERLVLLFSKAAFNFEMTDELFAAALESWGAKCLLRCLTFTAYYYGLAMILDACGLDRYPGLTADKPLSEQTGQHVASKDLAG